MRQISHAVAAVSLSLALAGCNAGASARGGAEQVGAGLGNAVTAPLDDLNLRRQEIPTVLLQAESNPYDLRNLNHCRTIAAEIARLDEALGPDTDAPPSQDGSYMSERAADAAASATLGAVRDTMTDFIPARSWVRRLTGADAHSKHVQSAIQAGLRRRSFLKGVGMQRNCAPPAAPAGFVPRQTRGAR
ncbi:MULTISPECIES: hypothetical protein [unclassified Brevundimonas]|uniref:hypothetical protein n=1 Tax=unclassified Brevundimonas TaxID=2622653 RepID=UPI0025C5CF72|nr:MULTISPECIES: hypothetical protein [unclassified Brevundimonas]